MQVAEIIIEKLRDHREQKDVVILLDSITSCSSYNTIVPSSERKTGCRLPALERPKRFFERLEEEGGSLTIVGPPNRAGSNGRGYMKSSRELETKSCTLKEKS